MVLVKLTVMTLIMPSTLLAADIELPHRDPFVPVILTQEVVNSAADSRSGGRKLDRRGRLELRGTLKANDKSYANIGGVLVGVGESHQGYELMFVGEGYIVLMNKGVELKLYLPKPQDDTDG